MTKVNQMLFMATLLLSTSACAIPRSDVLECGLPDGSKFILTSKYECGPLNKLNPHNSSCRENQEPFNVVYKPRNFFKGVQIPWKISYKSIVNQYAIDNSKAICARFGYKNHYFYAGAVFIINQNNHLQEIAFDEKMTLPPLNLRPTSLQAKIDQLNLRTYPMYGAITVVDNLLISEDSFEESGGNLIVAVWQSTSSDNGKTWSDPIITTNAKIFELGKTIYEQSFIARPISINGKKIEADFPSQKTQ